MRNYRVRGREGLGRRQHQYTSVVDLLIRALFGCVLGSILAVHWCWFHSGPGSISGDIGV